MNPSRRNLNLLPGYSKLMEMARQPFDLSSPDALTTERLAAQVCRAAGFEILYATERVDQAVLDALQSLADESGAVEQFLMMKGGAIMNRIEGFACENRQVLHTATRDIFAAAPRQPAATEQARQELAKLDQFLTELESGVLTNQAGEPFTDLINIGIGGSDLGPRAVYHALAAYSLPNRRVHFISNVDPDDAAQFLSGIDPARTLVNVVSKSGTTLETLTNEELARAAFARAGLDSARHFLAVTGKGSPLENPDRYLRTFYMYDYIGGRYSTTSMVGAVLLGFALGNTRFIEFLRGANCMDQAAENRNLRENPALLLAMLGIWNRNFLGLDTLAILPYSQPLCRFTAHLQQCDMESNGKSVTRLGETLAYKTGPIVWGEPGTNGQHAFYQLLHQGTITVPVEFIGFRESQQGQDIQINRTSSQEKLIANLLAQALALATGQENPNPNRAFAGNRPSLIILADRLDPFSMGGLLALYEAKIVLQGFVWNINSFDQEGVQLGKVLANRLLNHFSGLKQDKNYNGKAKDPLGYALLSEAGMLKLS
ncbi:MAG: glucose-6-phosphate isomerase [Deltaproteobacteria bacterium RIFOXYD12_FULL_50_9]|nr:MAG: glucose-6-phosphate isomerase [Deltaproteobacteria bacterium RIFOXYD12_FULL_50_9]